MRRITSREEWDSLSPDELGSYLDALHVVSEMRRGASFEAAAAQVRRNESEVLEWTAGVVIRSDGAGQWAVESEDSLYRRMRILRPGRGVQTVGVTDSNRASMISAYWSRDAPAALAAGDPSPLARYPPSLFVTDIDELIEWWRRGELDFLEIYET